jgi:hypothetical protein
MMAFSLRCSPSAAPCWVASSVSLSEFLCIHRLRRSRWSRWGFLVRLRVLSSAPWPSPFEHYEPGGARGGRVDDQVGRIRECDVSLPLGDSGELMAPQPLSAFQNLTNPRAGLGAGALFRRAFSLELT